MIYIIVIGTLAIGAFFTVAHLLGWDKALALWFASLRLNAGIPEYLCEYCSGHSAGYCENCDAALCADCDSLEFEDVMVCKDKRVCEVRCRALMVERSGAL